MIILPRRARDKHKESTQKEMRFYPQPTIYDSMYLNNRSFGLYINTSASTQSWNWTGGNDWANIGDVQFPDSMMEGVARHKDHFQTFDTFFAQAANGTLPQLSFVRGNSSNSDHPCYDVALGERLHKDMYEALRAGKKTPVLCHFIPKMIILPRQARDKDRKSRQKEMSFLAGPGWNRTLFAILCESTSIQASYYLSTCRVHCACVALADSLALAVGRCRRRRGRCGKRRPFCASIY